MENTVAEKSNFGSRSLQCFSYEAENNFQSNIDAMTDETPQQLSLSQLDTFSIGNLSQCEELQFYSPTSQNINYSAQNSINNDAVHSVLEQFADISPNTKKRINRNKTFHSLSTHRSQMSPTSRETLREYDRKRKRGFCNLMTTSAFENPFISGNRQDEATDENTFPDHLSDLDAATEFPLLNEIILSPDNLVQEIEQEPMLPTNEITHNYPAHDFADDIDLPLLHETLFTPHEFLDEPLANVDIHQHLPINNIRVDPPPLPYRNVARNCNLDNFDESSVLRHNCGTMSCICSFCNARYWNGEKNSRGKYSTCCQDGRVRLPKFQTPPLLQELLGGQTQRSKKLLEKARAFNTKLSCASISMTSHDFPSTRGTPTFRVSGSVYHNIGSILPNTDTVPKFLQCFFYETTGLDNDFRFTDFEHQMLRDVLDFLKQHNPIIQSIKVNLERAELNQIPLFQLVISDQAPAGAATRTYNRPTPTCSEIAAIVVGDGTAPEQPTWREILIQLNGNDVTRIPSHHSAYDPLCYGLTHSNGEKGWTIDIPYFHKVNGEWIINTGKKVTPLDFYSYRSQIRDPKWTADPATHVIDHDVLSFGRLLAQQYWVDMWVKIEEQRLKFHRNNQKRLKAELYQGLADAVRGNEHRDAGAYVVLPSSFQGGPRHQYASYHDAMAIVRKYGKPDLFLTFTCNPNWDEITNELRPNEKPWMRPDLIDRVFHLKFNSLLDDILRKNILGISVAHVVVVEFQKRGLPHCHLLIILSPEDKLHDVTLYDDIVCAEIPDSTKHPYLHSIVSRHLMHGPCGHLNPNCVCMEDGKCAKNFPKESAAETSSRNDSYPTYRRRNRFPIEKRDRHGNLICTLNDTWVVPYNPYLAVRYNAHINLEICITIQSVKYLFKYVYKGPDKASVKLIHADVGLPETPPHNNAPRNIDEIANYVDSRYVSACTALWHIFGYNMARHHPAVYRLQLHLPNQQLIHYEEGNEENALRQAAERHTMLTAYFQRVSDELLRPLDNQTLGLDPNGNIYPTASQLTYHEFPNYYTWNANQHEWSRRKRPHQSDTVGRIYAAHPSSGERFYLRILLNKVPGATSFDDLRTVNGTLFPTFKETCSQLGLLANSEEWKDCLLEAASTLMPQQLRDLFVTIIVINNAENPKGLWELRITDISTLADCMSEDFRLHRVHFNDGINDAVTSEDIDQTLHSLESLIRILTDDAKGLVDFELPLPNHPLRHRTDNPLILREMLYNQITEANVAAANVSKMNAQQKFVFDTINAAVARQCSNRTNAVPIVLPSLAANPSNVPVTNPSNVFFLDAPGGTGKTFVFNTILSYWRAKNKIGVAMASSGIAAILLKGGRTAHNRFKIPLKVLPDTSLFIQRNTNLAKFLMRADFFIWDEAGMVSNDVVRCVDRLLRDIMKKPDVPFGGKIFIFGGDFRQVLPVVPKQGRPGIVAKTLLRLPWWGSVHKLRLSLNLRVLQHGNNSEAREYAAFFMDIGNGTKEAHADLGDSVIQIPDKYIFQPIGCDP